MSTSGSLENNEEEYTEQYEELGLQPYLWEPEATESDSENSDQSESEAAGRVGCDPTECTPPVIEVQDWLTLRTKTEIVPPPKADYVSPRGTLRHVNSNKNLRPQGLDCPRKDHWVRVGVTAVEEIMKYRFVQREGHLGYIEHHCGTTIIHPEGGSTNPRDEAYVIMHSDRHSGALWYFDEENKRIVHYGGKYFWVNRDLSNPGEDILIKVLKKDNDATKFEFIPEDGSKSPYPDPTLTGRWEIIFAVIDPISEHNYSIKYKLGKHMIRQVTQQVAWKMSSSIAFSWFRLDSNLSYYACVSETTTWSGEVERSYSITVKPGRTSVTWQWVFEAERFGEKYQFRSSILGDTDDVNRPPNITPGMYPSNC